jgi:hypothetical protein
VQAAGPVGHRRSAPLDPAALTHVAAIQGALTFREGMLAPALAAELSPSFARNRCHNTQTGCACRGDSFASVFVSMLRRSLLAIHEDK